MLCISRNALLHRTALLAAATIPLMLTACGKDDTTTTPLRTAAQLNVVTGASQSGTVATALGQPIGVQVIDQSGNPMASVSVTFTVATNAGSVSTAQAVTDANGVAQVSWTLGTVAGIDSLTATSGPASVAIVATATPDVPATIAVVSGNLQSAPADSALAAPLAVKVTDQFGNAIANVAVQWSDDAGGAFTTNTVMTDANGIAQARYTLGVNPGTADVVASITVNGSPISAQFTETGA